MVTTIMRTRLLILLSVSLALASLNVHAIPATANLFIDVDGDQVDDFFQLDQVFAGAGTASIVGADSQEILGSDMGESFNVAFSYDTSADVASGEIKLKATFNNNSGQELSTGIDAFDVFSSQGVLQDTLQFTSTTGLPYDVVLSLDVTGSINNFNGASGDVSAFLSAAGFQSDQIAFNGNGNHATTLEVVATLAGTNASVDLFTSLSLGYFALGVDAFVDADFSNTAALSITLPAGVTLSGSKNGLLGAPTTVPLPGGLLFFSSAMLGLGLRRGRRR